MTKPEMAAAARQALVEVELLRTRGVASILCRLCREVLATTEAARHVASAEHEAGLLAPGLGPIFTCAGQGGGPGNQLRRPAVTEENTSGASILTVRPKLRKAAPVKVAQEPKVWEEIPTVSPRVQWVVRPVSLVKKEDQAVACSNQDDCANAVIDVEDRGARRNGAHGTFLPFIPHSLSTQRKSTATVVSFPLNDQIGPFSCKIILNT